MHQKDRPLLRCVVLVKPPDDLQVRPLIQPEQASLALPVEDDQGAGIRFRDVSDGSDDGAAFPSGASDVAAGGGS